MGGWWDDFSNNLATDLGPLISLFGEAPTKQYLSQCLSRTDIIIFATCPLGIITAVVSVIRVCGSPSLRAFVGRAREGAGVAEAELCSSTSRNVCELFSNNGGIVRVLGRPRLLELVHHPRRPHEDFGRDHRGHQTAGLYTSEQYFKNEDGNFDEPAKEEWVEKIKPLSWDNNLAPNPNIFLNVGMEPRNKIWFTIAACIGVFLQSFVLVWASIARYVLGMVRDDFQDHYAIPFLVIGTILLCTGMALCAISIEDITQERTFRRSRTGKPKSRMFWLQPGGQRVGDQVFDAFAYTHRNGGPTSYTTSWKMDFVISAMRVRVAILATATGFVMQFLGLRACHSSVAVVQLGVILIMSLVRVSLRTERLGEKSNLFEKDMNLCDGFYHLKDYEGYELDWIALQIERISNQRKGERPGGAYKWWVLSTKSFPLKRSISTDAEDPKTAVKMFAYRARLAQLTGGDDSWRAPETSIWDDTDVKARVIARNLALAIQRTTQVFFDSRAIHPIVLKNDWREVSEFFWTVGASFEFIRQQDSEINFSVRRDFCSIGNEASKGSWVINTTQLEATLGLWLYSLERDITVSHGVKIPITLRRIMSTNLKDESEFNLWRETGDAVMGRSTITAPIQPNVILVRKSNGTLVETGYDPEDSEEPRMFFGLHLFQNHPEPQITVLETTVTSSLMLTCAQELYALFLVSILQMVDGIGGQTTLDKASGRLVNENVSAIVNAFTSNRLGSTEDAFSCILPALLKHRRLPKPQTLHLRTAIDAGHEEMAMSLLKLVPDPDQADNDGWTPIMNAASKGHEDVVKALLETGQVDGWNALWASVQKGDRSMAETLLKIGHVHLDPDPGRLCDHLSSLLQLAAQNGSKDIVELLLHWEASPDVKDKYGWTPLCVAVGKGHQEITRKLVQSGKVDVNLRYPEGRCNRALLQVAIEGGFNEVVRELLNTGETLDVDARDQEGYTPLFCAAERGQEEIVKLLLETGRVDPKAATIHGWTPLTIALDKGFSQTAKILINTKKVDLNAAFPSGRPGRSLLQAVIEAGFNDVAELLIANPEVFVDREAQDGWTPLLAAAERGQTHLVPLLLARDVDPSIKHDRGWTALSVAVDKGWSETVEILLKTGQVNPNDRHSSSLASMVQIATDGGFEDTVRILLELGKADPDVRSRDSWTPLARATRWGKERIVKMLLDTDRVDLSYRSPKGESLLELAERSLNKEVIRLIKEATKSVPDSQEQEVHADTPKCSD